MGFFNDICNKVTDVNSLKDYLAQNIDEFWAVYYSSYRDLLACEGEIENFILIKHAFMSQLDFSNQENKFFVSALLDICLRINISSPVQVLYNIIRKNNIQINSRIEAGLSFIRQRPANADEMISLCEPICQKLQYAIDNEEDDDTKSTIVFLCYYCAALDSLHPTLVSQLKRGVESLMNAGTYPFLNNVIALRNINPVSPNAYSQVQQIIDSYYKGGSKRDRQDRQDRQEAAIPDFLIEENTGYSSLLRNAPNCCFDMIRQIAVQNSSNDRLPGRGVEILQKEAQLYTYLKSYGNMHKAKMLSAMTSPFPQHFDSPITIIDWGCGQALATMVFIDKYGSNCVNNIILIEPSLVAIKRASLHCSCLAPNSIIKTVNKTLDNVTSADIKCSEQTTIIHLFSNILDIDDYNVQHLVNLLDENTATTNYYVCVSPYIDDIKAGKIEHFVTHFSNNPSFEWINNNTNTKTGSYWKCNNTYRNAGMRHGMSNLCGNNPDTNGCDKRWTRISRVFKT